MMEQNRLTHQRLGCDSLQWPPRLLTWQSSTRAHDTVGTPAHTVKSAITQAVIRYAVELNTPKGEPSSMPPLKVRLGQAVRVLRVAAGYSQEDFADHVKVHRTFMSSIERGRINISLDTLERLARGLEKSAWQLLQIAEVGGAAGSYPPSDPPRLARRGVRRVAEDRDK
ncbi:MAG: helix-turn-helix transcriptional regulator [Gemmatimonadales bacterium]